MPTKKFNLGDVAATPGAMAAMEAAGVRPISLILRHVTGDWGTVCAADAQENEFALVNSLRILSVYEISNDEKVWVITEAERSVTTILLPSEY